MTAFSHNLIRAHPWTAAGMGAPALASWLLLLWGATHMDSPAAQLTMPMSTWSLANWLAVSAMWTVMMVAVMLPPAAPMVLCFAGLNRQRGGGGRTFLFAAPPAAPMVLELNRKRGKRGRTLLFAAAYLALWTGFSAIAAAAQWALQRLGWVSPMIVSTSSGLNAALLLTAGLYQFSPPKRASLDACRSPVRFLMSDWREGLWGASLMGIRHGLYCAGCCWALMALLFIGGVMNLLWIAVLAGLVAMEKLAPEGEAAAEVSGGAMIGVGVVMAALLSLPS